MKVSFIDAVVLLAPLLTAAVLTNPLAAFRPSRTIYVTQRGSDWNSGQTAASALATIQHAADLARPGDQILIGPGTYYERLHIRRGGTQAAPVRLVAETPGTVVITGKLPKGTPANWEWREEGEGIYSTAVTHPVYRLDHGEATCFRVPWGGPDVLRKIAAKPGAWSAFCQDDNRLFVALRGAKHPQHEILSTHRPAPAPREWGEFKSATVWIEADHIQLEGLQIEFGIGASVNIWNAQHVELRDCAFTGATFGVRCSGGPRSSRDVRIANCLYHNYPQYHWHKDWLTWDEVYAAYASSTLVASVDAPLTVENCFVTHAGDALRISPKAGQSEAAATVVGNYLAFCTDDAIEFDGEGVNVVVRENLIYEAHQNLGFSPVQQGPVRVSQNLFAHAPDGINGSQIKLINNRPGEAIRNIAVRENVFVGDWLCWWNDAPISDVTVENNRFFVQRTADPAWPSAGVTVPKGQIELSAERVAPEVAIAQWYRQSEPPVWVRTLLDREAGPSWWPSDRHPATRDASRWRTRLRQSLTPSTAVERN